MKGFRHLVLCCGGLLATASAAAATPLIYATLGLGYSEAQDMPSQQDYAVLTSSDDALTSSRTNYGGRIALGALWKADKFLSPGLEIGAASYGSYSYSDATSSLDMDYYGIEYLAVLQANMKRLKLIFKAGVDDERVDVSTSGLSSNAGFSSNSAISPEFSVGLGYKFTPKLQINATYYRIFGEEVKFNNASQASNLPSFDIAFLEVTYSFTGGKS